MKREELIPFAKFIMDMVNYHKLMKTKPESLADAYLASLSPADKEEVRMSEGKVEMIAEALSHGVADKHKRIIAIIEEKPLDESALAEYDIKNAAIDYSKEFGDSRKSQIELENAYFKGAMDMMRGNITKSNP